MRKETFDIVINSMDGCVHETQELILKWLKDNHMLDYVYMNTEKERDKMLVYVRSEQTE